MPVRCGLVLASASPRRLALLAQIGVVPDRVIAPNIDENPRRDEVPRTCVRRLALTKLTSVDPDQSAPGCVLAADTLVCAGRRILPKAETAEQARQCLMLLSGRRHRVMTAVMLARADGQVNERVIETVVTFARLTPAQTDAYVAGGEWQGKAGGYAIQGSAASFVRFISGSYSNVVGLPLFETAQLLRGAGWSLP